MKNPMPSNRRSVRVSKSKNSKLSQAISKSHTPSSIDSPGWRPRGPISACIPIEVDGISFMIIVFVETTSETIFSRGLDHVRVEFGHSFEKVDANTTLSARCIIPGILCSPIGSMASSPETHPRSSIWTNLKSLVFNDDGDCRKSILGFHRRQEIDRRDSNISRTLGAFVDEYMSSSEKLHERTDD
ncbi:hypothetical protein Ancab_012416 [Ancistrocladus abbreviatus]